MMVNIDLFKSCKYFFNLLPLANIANLHYKMMDEGRKLHVFILKL